MRKRDGDPAGRPAIAAVDVLAISPESTLGEDNLVQTIDALTFSGGSVYGLAAADGVTNWLRPWVKGYALRPAPACRSPLSCPPACTIWPAAATKSLAAHAAVSPVGHRGGQPGQKPGLPLGTVGRPGYGAMTGMGKLKGGLGSASIVTTNGATVSALVAVNCLGRGGRTRHPLLWATP